MSPTTKEASWSAGIQQLLLLGDNIGTRLQAVRPAPFDRRNGGKLGGGWKASRGGLTRFYCTTRGARALLPLILLSRPSMQEGSYNRPNPIQDF